MKPSEWAKKVLGAQSLNNIETAFLDSYSKNKLLVTQRSRLIYFETIKEALSKEKTYILYFCSSKQKVDEFIAILEDWILYAGLGMFLEQLNIPNEVRFSNGTRVLANNIPEIPYPGVREVSGSLIIVDNLEELPKYFIECILPQLMLYKDTRAIYLTKETHDNIHILPVNTLEIFTLNK